MKWKEKSTLNKITSAIVVVCSALIILFAALQLFGVWGNAVFVYLPLACVNMLMFTFMNWKTNCSVAVFNLVAAVFVLVCIGVIVFVK